ncbi:LysR family transcriptional regulator [Ferrimonas balearica]|uniref:LysR family transcriptional regulator n=1 Tax=Ferrimonas balearica TaxID=44012 RepID=UPI001C589F5A|nr:LysR family transcriptional regulator [Ferrimonas balearica]MBW3139771.1 LysR family transcriptional regulator [Ferrimonas balearica]
MKTRSDDLQCFLAVVDAGSFSAAAEALDLQVARISRAVTRLEQQLETTLLNRTTRRLELTEEGATFAEAVRAGLAQLDAAEEAVTQVAGRPVGRLRVDAASPFIQHQLLPHLAAFRQRYPEIRLELSASEGIIDLLEKRIDVAIRIGSLSDSTLHARPLGRSALHLVAAPDYLTRQGVPDSVDALDGHSLLGFIPPSRLNQWPLPGMAPIRPAVAVSNGELLRRMALDGHGIACLSHFMVAQDLEAGRLMPVLGEALEPLAERERVNAVFYQNSVLAERIRVFLDFIQPRLRL